MIRNFCLLITLLLGIVTSCSAELVKFTENYKVGYKNIQGAVIVSPIYDAGSDFEHGLALVVYNNKRGFIDERGIEVIQLLYEDATMFDVETGLACVKYAGKYGYINQKGEWIIQPHFANASGFTNARAKVLINNL